MRLKIEALHESGRFRWQVRGKDLIGAVRLILTRVVEDITESRLDFPDGKRGPREDSDRELATRHEALHHHLLVVG